MRPSLAAITESQLIAQLLADSHWRRRILGIHGIPRNVEHFLEVDHRKLGKSGDIDILAVEPNAPHLTTAIQVKRIRVHEKTFSSNKKPNKLSKIPKLIEQTNRLVELNFWQVFAFIFIAVDSRVRNSDQYQFDGLTQNLRQEIEKNIQIEKLDSRAGCVIFEITQPMEDTPLRTGTFSAHALRLPTPLDQPPRITKWVTENITRALVIAPSEPT